MTTVKFISCSYLKANTAIEMNMDDSKLEPYIIKTQDTHLQQAIGSSFYEHLSNAVATSTLTVAEENLIRNYIQRVVAEFTFYEVLPFINYKSTNKAISKESSEFSQAADLDEIKYLRNSVRDLAEFYLKRLTKYLCDHQADFPAYTNPDIPENLPKNSRSFFNGVYLPKNGGCTDC